MVTLGLTTVRPAGRRSRGATDRTLLEALPPGELARPLPDGWVRVGMEATSG